MKENLPGSNTFKITVLVAVFLGLLALALRVWGIKFGFPNVLCGVDENYSTSLAMRYGLGNLKPDFFWWPTLHSYLLFALYGGYYALGRLLGEFRSLFDFQKLYFTDPQSFFLIGRLFTAAAGSLSVVMLFFLAKKAYSLRVGFLAALFLAFNFLHVRDSHYSRPDILAGIFMMPAFMCLLSLKNKKDYLFTGILVGLAASVKYQYILILFPALIAHFMPEPAAGKKYLGSRFLHPGPLLMLLAAFLAFFATSPYIVLNLREMLVYVSHGAAAQNDLLAHYGFRNSFDFHFRISFLQGIGLPLLIAAAMGFVQSLARRQKADIVLVSFTVVYYLSITLGASVYMRYALPLLFPLLIFSARFADTCLGAVESLRLPKPGKAALAALLLFALLYLPAQKVFSYNSLMAEKDNRVVAAEWIEANIPGGSRIACAAAYWLECPVLRENKKSLADASRNIITEYRHKFLLALPDYPAEPSYYLTQLDESERPTTLGFRGINSDLGAIKSEKIEYIAPLGHSVLGFRGINAGLDAIKSEKIEYIVAIEHYPGAYPAISAELNALIRKNFVLYKELLPYSGSTPPSPLYDEPNGFYLPCGGFRGIVRPGPIIRIWKTAAARAATHRLDKGIGAQN